MSSSTQPAPAVAIVIATYNRSDVLRLAIASVVAQTLTDWELWVIGDACTDDSAAVVAAFGDPRIHFVNLPENVGEQAGPNNEGVARSRAPLVAFLNHDDLWFPDHLATAVAALEASAADLAFARGIAFRTDGTRTMIGLAPTGRYALTTYAPASLWLVRRELLVALGGWRSAYRCRLAPSQDFLARAHRAGKRLVPAPRTTVLVIPAGSRKDSYVTGGAGEHEAVLREMQADPAFRERLLEGVITQLGANSLVPRPAKTAARAGVHALYWCLERLGIHPLEAGRTLTLQRKGRVIDVRRRVRGLSRLDPLLAAGRTRSLRPEEETAP